MKVTNCRVCGGQLELIVSLGKIPIVNYFPSKEELKTERKYPLEVYLCKNCALVQLGYAVAPKKLFRNYHFLTSASTPLISHLDELSEKLIENLGLKKGSKVLDIGCNDGSLLCSFKNRGMEVFGVEPSRQIADMARRKGLPVTNDFFGLGLSETIRKAEGLFDLITATRVLANIFDLNDFLGGVINLLSPNGFFLAEVAAFDEMVARDEFDAIYHEHFSYFTPESINFLFRKNGLKIILQERTNFQGGELRIVAGKDTGRFPNLATGNLINYSSFAERVVNYKLKVNNFFSSIGGAKVAAFGAPAKGVTFLNYCALDSQKIEFIVDSTPFKQGKFIPGVHIPVYPEEYLASNKVDYCLLLAWNYKDQILPKIQKLTGGKTKIILPYPTFEIMT